jgi:hypothetical protein
MITVFVLLVLFQLKHFFADYPLQTKYMLGKFKDFGWEKPLLAHVGVHALFTFLITCYFGVFHAVCFAGIDATIHFVMDRFKADRRYLGRFKSLTEETAPTATKEQWRSNNYFWWSLGFDQMIHHLTHYFIIFWLVTQ